MILSLPGYQVELQLHTPHHHITLYSLFLLRSFIDEGEQVNSLAPFSLIIHITYVIDLPALLIIFIWAEDTSSANGESGRMKPAALSIC